MMSLILLLAILFLGAPTIAEACSCTQPSVCQSVANTNTIFE